MKYKDYYKNKNKCGICPKCGAYTEDVRRHNKLKTGSKHDCRFEIIKKILDL